MMGSVVAGRQAGRQGTGAVVESLHFDLQTIDRESRLDGPGMGPKSPIHPTPHPYPRDTPPQINPHLPVHPNSDVAKSRDVNEAKDPMTFSLDIGRTRYNSGLGTSGTHMQSFPKHVLGPSPASLILTLRVITKSTKLSYIPYVSPFLT
jgi:hypothetical protein